MKVSRRTILLSGVACLLTLHEAKPWTHGSFQEGKTVQNFGDLLSNFPFINFIKSAHIVNNGNAATLISDDGYPNGTLTASYSFGPTLPTNNFATQWVFKWTGAVGSGSIGIQFNTCTIISNSGTTISGGAGSGQTVVRGTNARIVLTFASMNTGIDNTNFFFQSGCVCSALTSMVFCKLSDEAAVDAGAIWNPDFIAKLRTQNPAALRFMGVMLNAGNEILTCPLYKYRTPTTYLGYRGIRVVDSRIWGGAITNSGNDYTLTSYPDMPVSWTDGETFQGTTSAANTVLTITGVANNGSGLVRLTMASTATLTTGDVISYPGYNAPGGAPGNSAGFWSITVINGTDIDLTAMCGTGEPSAFVAFTSNPRTISKATINVGSRGVRPLVGFGASVIPTISTTNPGMFVYSLAMNVVMYAPSSQSLVTGFNPELAIDLCNTLNMDCWINLPWSTTNQSAADLATAAKSGLNPNLNLIVEVTNEPWNSIFQQWLMIGICGQALNLSTNFQTAGQGFYGLKIAQLLDAMATAWSPRSRSQLKGYVNGQAVGGATSNLNTQVLNGSLLNAGSNAVLSAYTGGQSYNVGSPTFNRPVDHINIVGFAPYNSISSSTSDIYTLAQTYATGSQSSALDGLSTDMQNVSINTYTGAGKTYPNYEALLAGYDSDRPPGFAALIGDCYEGGADMNAPVVSNYVSAGTSVAATVTFNIGSSPGVNWTAHGLQNGCRVSFAGGTLPSNVTSGTNYAVSNVSTNAFDIVPITYSQLGYTGPIVPGLQSALTLTGSPSGTTTGTAGQFSVDNLMAAWLNDARAITWTAFYINLFASVANFPHMRRMAFLQLDGPNRWSQWPADLYSTPYQTFVGVQRFNGH